MDRTNASIEFSQHGNTTVNGSAQTHIEGVQLTASSTTNGSTTVGFNYNANNEGPRRGSNASVNYDTDNGQFSGSVSYTNTDYGIGGALNVDANGVSLSTQYNGNNVATVTGNGFQYDEFNWAQNNINVAQDMTGDAERAREAEKQASKDREMLIKNGVKLEDFAKLSRESQTEVIIGLRRHEENQSLFDSQRSSIDNNPNLSDEQKRIALENLAHDIENLTPQLRQAALNEMNHVMTVDQLAAGTVALLGSSAALFGFLGFSGNGTGQTPTNVNSNGPVVGRRPEEGEVDDAYDSVFDQIIKNDLDADVSFWEKELKSIENVTDANDARRSNYSDYARKMLAKAKENVANFVSDRQLSIASSTLALAKVLELQIGSQSKIKINWNNFKDLITKNPDLGKEIQGELKKLQGNVPYVNQIQLLSVIAGTIHYDQRSWSAENTRNYFLESLKNGAPLKDGDRRVTSTSGIDTGGPNYQIELNSHTEVWNDKMAMWIPLEGRQN